MARKSTMVERDPDEVDELERGRRWSVRYLVAWMPWLSLIKGFQDAEVREKEKRWSEQSVYLQGNGNQKIDFAAPPRRGQRMESVSVPERSEDGAAVRHVETV
jgi:hypothetical protein